MWRDVILIWRYIVLKQYEWIKNAELIWKLTFFEEVTCRYSPAAFWFKGAEHVQHLDEAIMFWRTVENEEEQTSWTNGLQQTNKTPFFYCMSLSWLSTNLNFRELFATFLDVSKRKWEWQTFNTRHQCYLFTNALPETEILDILKDITVADSYLLELLTACGLSLGERDEQQRILYQPSQLY